MTFRQIHTGRLLTAALLMLALLPSGLPLKVCGQNWKEGQRFRVMEYNVQNLFTATADSLPHDADFLPEGSRHWTSKRYRHKLNQLARVILATSDSLPPAVVALCEVGDGQVLEDLTRHSLLWETKYDYLTTSSCDRRGMRTAILYQRFQFRPLECQTIPLGDAVHPATRPLLHVSGLVVSLDTLDLLLVHLPSRRGGVKASSPFRKQVARQVRQVYDSLLSVRRKPYILVMGDCNESSKGAALQEVLKLHPLPDSADGVHPHELYSLYGPNSFPPPYRGSYKYRERWEVIDHLMANGALLQSGATVRVQWGKTGVAPLPFLLTEDERYGGEKPLPTYDGWTYRGGVSDHLPVYADLWVGF